MKIFTRHLLSSFTRIFIYLVILFTGISIISDFFRDLNIFLSKSIPAATIISYLALTNVHRVFQLMPVSALVAALFSISAMARDGEFTAVKIAGVNIRRAMAPFFIFGILLAAISFVAVFFVVPEVVSKGYEIKRVKILGMSPSQKKGRKRALSVALPDGGRLQAGFIDAETRTMTDVIFSEYDKNFSVVRQISARKVTWDGDVWLWEDGTMTQFKNDMPSGQTIITKLKMQMPYSPDDFAPEENLYPEEMSMAKHLSRIRSLKNLGLPYRREEVEFHTRVASAASVFMVLFIGVFFGLNVSPRHGKVFGFVTAILMAFIYYGISALGQALGENGILPPIAAAWLGNIIFGSMGLVLFYRIPT